VELCAQRPLYAETRMVSHLRLFAACDLSVPFRVGFDEHPLMLGGRVALFGEGSSAGHAHRRLSGRGEAGEILYLRAKLTLSSPSVRRANKDELPAIAGLLVDNSLGTGDRV
jgi:hypothetical protein